MTDVPATYNADGVRDAIFTVRGQKVILDADLAMVYGVQTKVLNQAVKRNADKFPDDFMFRLTAQELTALRSQIVTSKQERIRSQSATRSGKGGRRYLPYAFTEHGAIMAATVLNSPRAVQMSVFVVRAFVRMRAALTDTRELTRKLSALEREVKARLDTHDAAIVDILARIMDMIDPPEFAEPRRKQIGFGVKEKRVKYPTEKRPERESKGTARRMK